MGLDFKPINKGRYFYKALLKDIATARVIGRECNHMSYPARNDTYITYFLLNNKKYKCGNIQTYNYCKDKEYVNVIFRTRKFKNNVVKHAVIRVYFD